ncbi:MAG: leucyl/phenylalanyl-tRNA--protein transferase [Proteobacteria bacterium]|nr:leucyl/phenylalanyl-tRNA--protein transferase [Pseudomonadota bacterium]MBU1639682.1 leucyl/phenylalanyl-tRNA--protein transferase [Pseudomonadota bacterium]
MIFKLSDELVFPPPVLAREDGLLAVGGDLSVQRLLLAYSMGIFPWYSEGDPLLWWSPDPRMVLVPDEFHCSRRLERILRQEMFRVTFDQVFTEVIQGCAAPRPGREATWIVKEMQDAYIRLHEEGWAHSVECWLDDQLVGGLYGVSLGGVFFGESMFSTVANSSKVALATLIGQLAAWDFDLLDCQMKTSHLVSLGAREISGVEFGRCLQASVQRPTRRGVWSYEG